MLLEALRWLGIDWDEGVEAGGPHGPYRQSQRDEIYQDVLARLKQAGFVYESYSTPEEVEERHRAAGRDPKLGYDNYDRGLSEEQVGAFRLRGASRCCASACRMRTSPSPTWCAGRSPSVQGRRRTSSWPAPTASRSIRW